MSKYIFRESSSKEMITTMEGLMRSLRQASQAAPKARTVDRPVKIPTNHHRSFHSKTIDPGMVTATKLHIFLFTNKSPTCMCFCIASEVSIHNNVLDYKVKQRIAWFKDSDCFKVKLARSDHAWNDAALLPLAPAALRQIGRPHYPRQRPSPHFRRFSLKSFPRGVKKRYPFQFMGLVG